MRKRVNKKMLYITLSVMIISVFTLTIAYAVLSTTLNITGSAEVSGSSWGITVNKFYYLDDREELTEAEKELLDMLGWKLFDNGIAVGDANLIREATISGTSISNLQISLIKPGDGIMLYYTVTNNGTIPAKIDSMTLNTPSFTSSTNNTNDIELISNNWLVEVNLLNNFDGGESLDVGYILCPGETIYLEYGAAIDENATAVPSSNITVSNLGGTVNFVQADKSSCSNS